LNIQEYISSGILEAYALGDVTPAERADVEQVLLQYPEVKQEFDKVEKTMETLVRKSAIAAPVWVKEKIMAKVSLSQPEANIVPIRKLYTPVWRYATAASIAIALLTSYLAYDYRSRWIEKEIAFNELNAKNQKIAEDYNVVNEKLDKIQGDLSIMESTAFRKIVLKGTANDLTALASVYWNESTREVYISVQNLKRISRENQFQLWAIVDGKPVDAGVFDGGFAGLLKMKNISGAAAFAVTVEPRGGKESPTLSTMQVIGALPREKS
jgi:anti-sigma-K factor RskA